jgi:hypothetical protein
MAGYLASRCDEVATNSNGAIAFELGAGARQSIDQPLPSFAARLLATGLDILDRSARYARMQRELALRPRQTGASHANQSAEMYVI